MLKKVVDPIDTIILNRDEYSFEVITKLEKS